MSTGCASRRDTSGLRRRLSRSIWLGVFLALCLTLPKLEQGDFNVDTGRYAALALQAWRSAVGGEPAALVTLRGGGDVPYFNKPPLVFWLHGPVLLAAGPRLWAARLPGVAAVVLAVVSLFWLADRAGCKGQSGDRLRPARSPLARRVAVISACVLATTYAFTSLSHAISPDLWMTAFIALAFVPAVEAVRRDRGVLLALSGVGVGLALLTKPLVALLVPFILLLWLCVERRWTWLKWAGAALLVALLIAAPWHLAMVALHGRDFVDEYFGREIVSRASGNFTGLNEGAASPLYYPRILLQTYWPWLPVLFGAIIWAMTAAPRRWRPWVRLALLWGGVFFVAMLVHPDKRPRYLASIYVPASWLIGMWLASLRAQRWRNAVDFGLTVAAPVAAVVALLVAILPVRVHGGTPRHWQEFFEWHAATGHPVLWEGGFGWPESSRVYLETGRWPEPTFDGLNRQVASPPAGSLIAYHERHAIQPGLGEEVVFESANGDVYITRLAAPHWQPRDGDLAD